MALGPCSGNIGGHVGHAGPLAVLVPALDPGAALVDLVADLRAAAPGARLVVVDDGSAPDSRVVFDVVRRQGATVVAHTTNRGKGCALRTGLRHVIEHCPCSPVVCADADGQHAVTDVLRVAAELRAGHGVVLGVRRFDVPVPLRSRFGNSVTRALVRRATGQDIRDTQTGLRGYAAALLPRLITVPGDRFEYEFAVLLELASSGIPIRQVDIGTIYLDGNTSSHFRPVTDSLRVCSSLLQTLVRRPDSRPAGGTGRHGPPPSPPAPPPAARRWARWLDRPPPGR
jgi:glycosyltransferase involved in cell wall biosynthesis